MACFLTDKVQLPSPDGSNYLTVAFRPLTNSLPYLQFLYFLPYPHLRPQGNTLALLLLRGRSLVTAQLILLGLLPGSRKPPICSALSFLRATSLSFLHNSSERTCNPSNLHCFPKYWRRPLSFLSKMPFLLFLRHSGQTFSAFLWLWLHFSHASRFSHGWHFFFLSFLDPFPSVYSQHKPTFWTRR